MLQVLNLFHRLAQRRDQRGPLPGRTRPQLRLRDAGQRSNDAVKEFLGQRSRRGEPARLAAKERRRRRSRNEGRRRRARRSEEEEARRSRRSNAEAARQRRTGAGRAKRAKPRRKIVAAQGRRRLPGLLPDPAAVRRRLRRKRTPTNTSVDPRVYHLKDNDKERHAAYRMVGVLEPDDGTALLRHAGDPRLGRPADPRRPDLKPRRSTAASTTSTSTAARSSWSPGTAATTPTGSPTPAADS